MWKFVFLCCFLFFVYQICAEYPYCFRFTWLGPYQDKAHLNALTCDDLREDAANTPCRMPLAVTDNDTLPDTNDLWRKYHDRPDMFACPMTPGQSCVKYTYIYKNAVQNITYMCAKVNATNGCYKQRYISGLSMEVCVCHSRLGAVPCNGAATPAPSNQAILLPVMLTSVMYRLCQMS